MLSLNFLFIFQKLWSGDIFLFSPSWAHAFLCFTSMLWSHMYHMAICLGKWFSPQLGSYTFLRSGALLDLSLSLWYQVQHQTLIQTLRTIYWSELREMFLAHVASIKASCFAFLSWSLITKHLSLLLQEKEEVPGKIENQVIFLFTNLAWKGVF